MQTTNPFSIGNPYNTPGSLTSQFKPSDWTDPTLPFNWGSSANWGSQASPPMGGGYTWTPGTGDGTYGGKAPLPAPQWLQDISAKNTPPPGTTGPYAQQSLSALQNWAAQQEESNAFPGSRTMASDALNAYNLWKAQNPTGGTVITGTPSPTGQTTPTSTSGYANYVNGQLVSSGGVKPGGGPIPRTQPYLLNGQMVNPTVPSYANIPSQGPSGGTGRYGTAPSGGGSGTGNYGYPQWLSDYLDSIGL